MNVTQLLQSIVDGLATGSTYSLVALSFTLVWATVRTVDLALLQIIALAGVVAFEVSGNGPVVALLAGVLAAVVVTTFSHYVAIRPTLHKGQIYPIVASIGLGLLVVGLTSLAFGLDLHTMPNLVPSGGFHPGPLFVSWTAAVVISVTGVLLVAAGATMRYTRIGLAFRASAAAPDLAEAYGVGVGSVRRGAAVVAGAGVGLAGVFGAVLAGSVSPFFGAAMGLNGIVAMLIGGAGNLSGAVFGGVLIGVLESVSSQYMAGSSAQIVSYSLLFFVMIVRPTGLMKGSTA